MSDSVCPYLGLMDDPSSLDGFPSGRNACHHVATPTPVAHGHQSQFCLQAAHQKCPVFRQQAPRQLPKGIRAKSTSASLAAPSRPLWVVLAVAVGVVAVIAAYFGLPSLSHTPAASAPYTPPVLTNITPTATAPTNAVVLPLPSPTPQPVHTATQTLTPPTATPTPPAGTPTPTPGPLLETPFPAIEGKMVVIHQVQRGESFYVLENIYHTSQEAIEAINYFLPVPLWPGWLMVIPVNASPEDVANWPKFEVYLVSDGPVPVAMLAASLKVDEEVLRLFNHLEQDVIPQGRWLLIPREEGP